MSGPRFLLLVLLTAVVVQAAHYYPQMPERIASHFSGGGRLNDSMSKEAFFAVWLGMAALVAALFLALPRVVARVRPDRFSMPHRDYWLAPKRREQTIAYISRQIGWFGCATLLFLFVVGQFVFEANLSEPARLSGAFQYWLFLYFGFAAVWAIRLVYRFRNPPAQDLASPPSNPPA